MKVFFHEDFYQSYTSDPAAAEGRIEAIMEVIEPAVEFVTAAPASAADIAEVHTDDHISHVRNYGLYDIAALAAGGAIQTASRGLAEPCFGLIRPPGHHASSNSAWGFCYFSNMAIALEALKKQQLISTAYVLDIDMHFGDGTVNTIGSKKYVTVYNPTSSYREAYLDEVRKEMESCRVDLIGISAGFDNHEEDWGGVLKTKDYQKIGRLVRDTAHRNEGGCFAILEGGYNHRVLGRNVMALIEGLTEGK